MTARTFTVSGSNYNTAQTINMSTSDTLQILQAGDGSMSFGGIFEQGTGFAPTKPSVPSSFSASDWTRVAYNGLMALFVTDGAKTFPEGTYALTMGWTDDINDDISSGATLTVIVEVPSTTVSLTGGHNYILSCKDAYVSGSAGIQSITQSGNSLTVVNKSPIDLIDLGAGTDTGDAKVIVNTPDTVCNAKDYRTGPYKNVGDILSSLMARVQSNYSDGEKGSGSFTLYPYLITDDGARLYNQTDNVYYYPELTPNTALAATILGKSLTVTATNYRTLKTVAVNEDNTLYTSEITLSVNIDSTTYSLKVIREYTEYSD